MNIEVIAGRKATLNPGTRSIATTATPALPESEVSGRRANNQIIKCWNCGGLSYAAVEDDLAGQVYVCTFCGEANQP